MSQGAELPRHGQEGRTRQNAGAASQRAARGHLFDSRNERVRILRLHRGDVVSPAGTPTMRKTGKLECPDNPGQFAEYTLSDWKQGTESEVDKLPR